jgi:D-sedoheptulose 7-phosphate isomerase
MSAPPGSSFETLYPFLYADATDLDAVLAQVRESTVAKAAEIVALRQGLADRYGVRLVECARRMAVSFAAGGKLFTFGNGGSSTDAQEVAQLYLHPSAPARPLPAICLTHDVAVLTALSNDVGFEVVFARQVAAFGRAGDIALGLSTSGGSVNVLSGFDEAARRGLVTVGLAGYEGGRMAESDSIDHLFVVTSPSVHRVQEAQATLYHVLWELTQQVLDGQL